MKIMIKSKYYQISNHTIDKSQSVNPALGLLMVFCIGFIPINIFPRGGFQIVDIFIVILATYYIFAKSTISDEEKKQIYLIVPFYAWASMVVIGYSMYYGVYSFLIIAVEAIYHVFMFYAYCNMWNDLFEKKAYKYIYLSLIVSTICVFSFKGYKEWEGMRYAFSFNNPNALALYALVILCIIILLMKQKKEDNITNKIYYYLDIFFIILSHYLAFMAISRGTLAAFVVLDVCLLKNMLTRDLFLPVAGTFAAGMIVLLTLNPHFIQERIEARGEHRFGKQAFTERLHIGIEGPLEEVKGFKILYGTGYTGAIDLDPNQRIRAKMGERKLEVHNMFGNVLYGYGVIGLSIYLYWIIRFIWLSKVVPNSFWIWGALLTFSVSGVLIRSRNYWLVLAMILALASIRRRKMVESKQKIEI